MMTKMLTISAVLLSSTGCLNGKFSMKRDNCSEDEHRVNGGKCAAIAKPTLSSSAALTNANPILVTATFTADVTGLSASGITVTNGQVASITGEGAVYVIAVTPQQDGEVSVQLQQGAAKNLSGRNSPESNRLNVTYDGTLPTLSLVSIDRSALDMSATPDPTLNLQLSEAASVTLYKDDACSQTISEMKNLVAGTDQNIKADGLDRVSKTHIYGKAVDAAGNASACTSLTRYVHILKFVDPNPSAGNGFGDSIVELSNGNVVITSPQATVNGVSQAGAVYLFNGETGALISTLHGSTAGDGVGYGGVTALTNGNFVTSTYLWDCQLALGCAGTDADVGAVTWGSGVAGINGAVSTSNSLVGSTLEDWVGIDGVFALTNGNYVVPSRYWDCQATLGCGGTIVGVGAVTWGNGTTGTSGVVSATNSLIGSTAGDVVGRKDTGRPGVVALSNGNYVVRSQVWDNGGANDAGAVTWVNGTTGLPVGAVTSSNSLVGSLASDQVGYSITALTNGNYVVCSHLWGSADIGAATWVNGTTGLPQGVVGSSNSLIGVTSNDQICSAGAHALTNGNYVVASSNWDNGATANAGAVTWLSGATGVAGVSDIVSSASNSLVGSSTNDYVGTAITVLTNGNYVVRSQSWSNGGTLDVGAVTWRSGVAANPGVVSAANSLIGSTASDGVGSGGVFALTNGNYVVATRFWANVPASAAAAGAVTWGDGAVGTTGVVSAANSLVGSTSNDEVGHPGVTPLSNGNYVVVSRYWDNGAISNAGAVTWGSGTTGVSGAVSASNSLVGSTAGDSVGINGTVSGVTALPNGNYVVVTTAWDNGTVANVGAVTWGDGASGISGAVSQTNSLIGINTTDSLGNSGVAALTNGNYIVRSRLWNNDATADVGAVTWGNGATGASGTVSASNSIIGSTANDQVGNSTAVVTTDGNFIFRSSLYGPTDLGLVIKIPGSDGVAGSL